MEKGSYIITSWDMLTRVAPGEPFSCWVHMGSTIPESFEQDIMHLARSGAASFFVTGRHSAGIHDAVDDVLESLQRPEIPTIWSDEITADLAWEFLHVRFGDQAPSRHVVVVATPEGEELATMSSIVDSLERAAAE